MSGDRFISNTNNVVRNQNKIDDEDNFFMQNEPVNFAKISQTQPLRRINDYDANILREDAYKEVSDELFKLEYKISKQENELAELTKQIKMAEEIHDYFQADKLNTTKEQLIKELAVLKDMYNEASISAKISDDLTSKIKEKFLNTGKTISNFFLFILSKIPGKVSSIIEVKQSLETLESINKSVDELMNSRYPYGEASYKYEQLSKYIARANSIQSQISGFMK